MTTRWKVGRRCVSREKRKKYIYSSSPEILAVLENFAGIIGERYAKSIEKGA